MYVHAQPQSVVVEVDSFARTTRDAPGLRAVRRGTAAAPLRVVGRDSDPARRVRERAGALALDGMTACARALEELAREEAALLLERLIDSGEPPTSAEVRLARATIARFVESYRGLAQRQAADAMFDALASAPATPPSIALRPLGDDRFARLGGRALEETLAARGAAGDRAAVARLALLRFAWGRLGAAQAGDGGDARGRALVEWARHPAAQPAGDGVELAAAVYSARPFPLGEALLVEGRLARLSRVDDRAARRRTVVEALRDLATCEPERDPDRLAAALALFARGALAFALPMALGRAEHALEDLHRAIDVALEAPDRVHASARACIEGNARLAMAELSSRLGRREEALRHAERAVAIDGAGPIGRGGREIVARLEV